MAFGRNSPGQAGQIISYAWNVGQEGLMVNNAPADIKRISRNRCKGAISGLMRVCNHTKASREMSHIDRIVKACDAGKMSEEQAVKELEKIGVKYGINSQIYSRAALDINIVRHANGKGRGDLAAPIALPKFNIFARPRKLPTKRQMPKGFKLPTKREMNNFVPMIPIMGVRQMRVNRKPGRGRR